MTMYYDSEVKYLYYQGWIQEFENGGFWYPRPLLWGVAACVTFFIMNRSIYKDQFSRFEKFYVAEPEWRHHKFHSLELFLCDAWPFTINCKPWSQKGGCAPPDPPPPPIQPWLLYAPTEWKQRKSTIQHIHKIIDYHILLMVGKTNLQACNDEQKLQNRMNNRDGNDNIQCIPCLKPRMKWRELMIT